MLNLVVDTYKGVFQYELNEFADTNQIKWLASALEGSIKDLIESVYNEHRNDYEELKEYVEKYLSKTESYEKDREDWLKNNLKKRVFLQIRGKMYDHQVAYDYSEIEDLAIILMLMFVNIYDQLLKVNVIKAWRFKKWAIEEIGMTSGSSFWHTLEFCILD